jgi:hypothetical protein
MGVDARKPSIRVDLGNPDVGTVIGRGKPLILGRGKPLILGRGKPLILGRGKPLILQMRRFVGGDAIGQIDNRRSRAHDLAGPYSLQRYRSAHFWIPPRSAKRAAFNKVPFRFPAAPTVGAEGWM